MKDKFQATKELIDTQLELKHIEESYSPWNSPIFVIKKKSIKCHLLTDLRKVNASMKPMGALQPRIPSPTTIPQNWHIIITDLQDCFLNISFQIPILNLVSFSVLCFLFVSGKQQDRKSTRLNSSHTS